MPAQTVPQRLLPRHHIIMRLQATGLTIEEIATTIGLSANSVSHIINSDVYKAEYAKFNETISKSFESAQTKIREKISALVAYGVEELNEILRDKTTPKTLRANIVFELLDRDGYKAPKERESSMDYLDAMTKAYERKLAEQSTKSE